MNYFAFQTGIVTRNCSISYISQRIKGKQKQHAKATPIETSFCVKAYKLDISSHKQPCHPTGSRSIGDEDSFNSIQQPLAASKFISVYRGASSKSFCASQPQNEKAATWFSLINSLQVWWRTIILSRIRISGPSLPDPCPLKEMLGSFFDKDSSEIKKRAFFNPGTLKFELAGNQKDNMCYLGQHVAIIQ